MKVWVVEGWDLHQSQWYVKEVYASEDAVRQAYPSEREVAITEHEVQGEMAESGKASGC